MEGNNVALMLSIIAIVAVAFVVGSGITGFAATESGKGVSDNTPCARDCNSICHDSMVVPLPGGDVAYLNVDDCITQCLGARCGQATKARNCNPDTADDCCNIFSTPGQDPDCVTCKPAGTCVDMPSECCSGQVTSDPLSCPASGIKCL